MFEVDVETMLPVKINTYFLNVSDPYPQWTFDHEMTDLYKMKDLSPRSFAELSERIFRDEETALTYQNKKSSNGPQSYEETCDQSCRRKLYCQTMNSVHFEVL